MVYYHELCVPAALPFGPEARTRVWAIFDKSKPDATVYDILYSDRNADGDLTVPEKRIEGKVEASSVTFDIGSFTFCAVPDTFLPKEVAVLATLLYTDKDGKERRAQSKLRERC